MGGDHGSRGTRGCEDICHCWGCHGPAELSGWPPAEIGGTGNLQIATSMMMGEKTLASVSLGREVLTGSVGCGGVGERRGDWGEGRLEEPGEAVAALVGGGVGGAAEGEEDVGRDAGGPPEGPPPGPPGTPGGG